MPLVRRAPHQEVTMSFARSAAVLVLAPLLNQPPALPAPPSGALPLPAPSGPLQFDAGAKEIGLDELCLRLAQLTGQELAMRPEARQQLAQLREPLESAGPVPAEEVYTFVEALLARQGFLVAPVSGGARPVLGVHVAGERHALHPVHVGRESLPELAAHPALLVRLLVTLEHTDSRQVQTQLRQITVDSENTNQCVPVGDRGLILQGRARDVADLARMVLEADEAAGKLPPLAPPVAPTEGG
jgi:hypothetical protein